MTYSVEDYYDTEPEPRDREAEAAMWEAEAERRADEAQDEYGGHLARARARTGQGRGALIVTAAGLDPVVASLTALRVALDATAQACGLPAGAPPSVVEFAATRDRELAEAVRAWRDVDRDHGTDGPGWDALLRLRDAADRYAGLGIGDVA